MIEPVSVPILLDVELSIVEYDLQIEDAIIVRRYEADDYAGVYEVTPDVMAQTLETENKVLRQNVIVKEIPMGLATTSQIKKLF